MMKKIPNYQPDQLENQIIKFWQDNKIFEKSLDKTKGGEVYSFYDGPPFANGLPHFGHNLVTAIKDAFGRYETMRGHYVPRRLGWDCHGLPVETKIEKELGIKNKRDIEERVGIANFNQACRASVFKYKDQWEKLFTRLGRWADSEDYYATLDDNYIESVWWVFSEAYKQGLVYQGQRPTGYCPRCATPLSNFELNQGYKDNVKDPSLVVKFPLKNQENTYFLVWTTTPWTLPGNLAIAISPSQTYFKVKIDDQFLILAEERLGLLGKQDYRVVDQYLGQDLISQEYQALYPADSQLDSEQLDRVYRLYPGDFVSMEEGSGLVHIAPAFGEDDNTLAKEYDLPVLISVDQHGMMADYTDFAGVFVKDADKLVIEELEGRDLVFESKQIRHTYPFCWRCDSPLIYYVVDTWYIEVSKLREKLVHSNQDIRWIPEHFKDGRFGNWLAGARDWAVSRNRYWGSPIPIWHCKETGEYVVVSSLAELRKLSVESIEELDLHRPGIDNIKLRTPSGGVATRVEEVFDCWFESGAMPYASIHYPFENKDLFDKSFPAKFIAEGQDQTRGWFYTLHVLAAILYDRPAFENVVVNGLVLASDGKKLSKKLKNYNDPEEVINQFGADSLRFYLLNSAATNGQSIKFIEKDLATIKRNVMMTLYASVSFLTLYAEIDSYQPDQLIRPTKLISPLDNWILARLDQTNQEIVQAMDDYQFFNATSPLVKLIDDLSNWYIRRSRKRFWKSDNDQDKNQAYQTLHYVLVEITKLMAPWSPFISEYLYGQLMQGVGGSLESVHLVSWPLVVEPDQEILSQMIRLRDLVTEGLAQRAKAGIKLRQPLASAKVRTNFGLNQELIEILTDELNLKQVKEDDQLDQDILVDLELTDRLIAEGMIRDLVRQVQSTRKKLDLEVTDRIKLMVDTESETVSLAIKEFEGVISTEVLADQIDFAKLSNPDNQFELGEQVVRILITKS